MQNSKSVFFLSSSPMLSFSVQIPSQGIRFRLRILFHRQWKPVSLNTNVWLNNIFTQRQTYQSRSLMHLCRGHNYVIPIHCSDNSQWNFHVPGTARRPTKFGHFQNRSLQTVGR